MDVRKTDAVKLAFYSGVSLVFLLFGIFFAILPATNKKEDYAHS